MSDKNANVERQLRQADKVLEQCKQRQIDPVETLRKAVRNYDRKQSK